MSNDYKKISIRKLQLDVKNPRFETPMSEREAIEFMLSNERIKLRNCAKDIHEFGLSPTDRLIVEPVYSDEDPHHQRYIVLEGNRRVASLKLLNDPDLAPASERPLFKRLSKSWSDEIRTHASKPSCWITTREKAHPWIERRHSGEMDGKGKVDWSPAEQDRFNGGNSIATQFRDYCVEEKLVSASDIRSKYSVIERFLDNPDFRNAIGISFEDGSIVTTIEPGTFNRTVKMFLGDVVSGNINTRYNKDHQLNYVQKLHSKLGVVPTKAPSVTRVWSRSVDRELEKESSPEDLVAEKASVPKEKDKLIDEPKATRAKSTKIASEVNIKNGLQKLDNQKLTLLYQSICKLTVSNHSILLYVACSAFLETLYHNAYPEKNQRYSAERDLKNVVDECDQTQPRWKEIKKGLNRSIEDLTKSTNLNKHDAYYANVSGDQLKMIMKSLSPVILVLLDKAQANQTNAVDN